MLTPSLPSMLEFLFKERHRACYLKALALLHTLNIKNIVELGVFRGKNAKKLRALFPKAHLYLVDPWRPDPTYLAKGGAVAADPALYQEAFSQVTSFFRDDPQVTLLRATAKEAAPTLPDNLDLVFIDANHAYDAVKATILTYFPKLSSRAILSGHNYRDPNLPGVTQAVDELFNQLHYTGQDRVWAVVHTKSESHRRGLEPLTT